MQDLLYQSALIALKAGEIALKYYGDVKYTLKEDSSPLTQADLESNAYILEHLALIAPYKICSEEAVLDYNERKSLDYYWLIDPLDGTKDFIAQNGGWTINIALIHKKRPILGVVYAPCFSELYIALQGLGAFSFDSDLLKQNNPTLKWLKEHKQKLNGERKIQDSQLIACDSMFHSTKETLEFFEKYDLKAYKCGSSLKVCTLAKGEADIYPRFNGTSEWDMAACDIILQESGGVIIDRQTKKPLEYNKPSIKNNHFIAFAKSQIGQVIYRDFLG